MNTPIEIHFNGVEKSAAIESKIEGKVAALAKRFPRFTSARIVIEAPQGQSTRARVYRIKIELGLPGKAPLIALSSRDDAHEHEDIVLAIRDAFEAARRQLEETADRLSTRTRSARGQRRPRSSRSDNPFESL